MKNIIKFILVVLFSFPLFASEKEEHLGDLELKSFLFRTSLTHVEKNQYSFDNHDLSLSFSWKYGESLSAVLRLGTENFFQNLQYYDPQTKKKFGFYEAYAQWEAYYGRFRMGLIPLEYGREGQINEEQLFFERPLLFKENVVALRDYGLSYEMFHSGYFTRLAIHNGDKENLDDRLWITGSWGKNFSDAELGLSVQVGNTKSESTSQSVSTLAGFSPNEKAHWGLVGSYVRFFSGGFHALLEYTHGRVKQDITAQNGDVSEYKGNFYSGVATLSYYHHGYGIHLRSDILEPNKNVENDRVERNSLGISYSSKFSRSVFGVILTDVDDDKVSVPDNEYQIFWRLSPKALFGEN